MSEKKRLYYLDTIRVVLTLFVIVHHAAIAYGAQGLHPYKDPNPDAISPIVLGLIVAVNQSYFMSAFFFLSGYFTPRSLERKGARAFLSDRFIRLGIPIIAYMLIFLQLNEFIVDVWLKNEAFGANIGWNVGHLWFLQALLLFNLGYVLFKQLRKKAITILPNQFPSNQSLWLWIGGLALVTFLVRIIYPIAETILGMQPAHFGHYIVAFCAGVLAYRGKWLEHLDATIGKYWGKIALITIPTLAVLSLIAGVFNNPDNAEKFLGGLTPVAFGYSVWDTVLFVAITIWMLWFFQKRYNFTNKLLQWLSANAFAVYIIHQTVLVAVNVALDGVNLTSSLKFVVAVLITIPLCFGLSDLLRRIPGTRRVLG